MSDIIINPGWGVLVALAAVVLSQLPPIRQWYRWYRGKDVRILAQEKLQIYQSLGIVNCNMYLSIRNSGGRPVEIRSIEFLISSAGGDTLSLPVESYYPKEATRVSGQNWVEFPINVIPLKADEVWSEWVHCYRNLDITDEEEMANITSEAREIFPGAQWTGIAPPPNGLTLNDDLVKRATDFFNSHFTLRKGVYFLLMIARSTGGEILTKNAYRFTLFENHISVLKSQVERYRSGVGIVFSGEAASDITVRLEQIHGSEADRIFQRLKQD